MSLSSVNSFVVLKNLNDTVLEGSIVETVSASTNSDINSFGYRTKPKKICDRIRNCDFGNRNQT